MVDIYRSRSGRFYRCLYWKRDLTNPVDNETLVHENNPSGVFYAKIKSSKFRDKQDFAGVFRVGTEGLTLETEDIVDLDKDDLVRFKNEIWIVGRVNNEPVQRNSEFSSNESNVTYIEISKGR